jgi:hypothetical protein
MPGQTGVPAPADSKQVAARGGFEPLISALKGQSEPSQAVVWSGGASRSEPVARSFVRRGHPETHPDRRGPDTGRDTRSGTVAQDFEAPDLLGYEPDELPLLRPFGVRKRSMIVAPLVGSEPVALANNG